MTSDPMQIDGQPANSVQTNNPLEQFVILAKSTKGAACAELVRQVLEASGVHVFGELLEMTNIKELETGEYAKYFNTLNLFAYGTYRQYLENKEKIIELTPAMKKKLQHLTIITMAIRSKCISYSDLLMELDINNVRDLEDMIIEAIYADIIHGKLDQKNSQLEIDYAIGRDIRTSDISEIAATLREWCESCETTLRCIEDQIEAANNEKASRLKQKDSLDQEVLSLKKILKTQEETGDPIDSMGVRDSTNFISQELRKKQSKSKGQRSAVGGGVSKSHR